MCGVPIVEATATAATGDAGAGTGDAGAGTGEAVGPAIEEKNNKLHILGPNTATLEYTPFTTGANFTPSFFTFSKFLQNFFLHQIHVFVTNMRRQYLLLSTSLRQERNCAGIRTVIVAPGRDKGCVSTSVYLSNQCILRALTKSCKNIQISEFFVTNSLLPPSLSPGSFDLTFLVVSPNLWVEVFRRCIGQTLAVNLLLGKLRPHHLR